MTDRAAPESPQEPVNGVQVVVPLDPQTHSNPEFSEPMLDVHAPPTSLSILGETSWSTSQRSAWVC
jgi:hypothetical protein